MNAIHGDKTHTENNTRTQYTPSPFLSFQELLEMLPMSSRTLRARIADGHIPYIRPSGAKRLLFHWPTVEQALLKDTITGGGSK